MLIKTFITSIVLSLNAQQDFTLINGSSMDLCGIYVSPSYMDHWQGNILGASQRLLSGNSIWIPMEGYGSHCEFNVRVLACQGPAKDGHINLCNEDVYKVD